MRTTTTIALLLFVSAIFAYPTLRGDGITKFTEYAEDHLELIDEITLDDKSVVVRRAPATQARFRMGANSPFTVPQAEKSECDFLARCMFSLLDDYGCARITIDNDVGIYRTKK